MFIAKWYTRASRVRIVIAKFDGRWKLPGHSSTRTPLAQSWSSIPSPATS